MKVTVKPLDQPISQEPPGLVTVRAHWMLDQDCLGVQFSGTSEPELVMHPVSDVRKGFDGEMVAILSFDVTPHLTDEKLRRAVENFLREVTVG